MAMPLDGAQISRGFVGFVESDKTAGADKILLIFGVEVVFVDVLAQLGVESANPSPGA